MYGVGAASGSGCEPAGSSIGSSRTKRAPLAVSREAELAAHPLGELAADGQAEAEAALARRRAAALEALEDPLALVVGHARAVVGDRDVRVLAVVARAHADRPRAGGARRSALSSRMRTTRATALGSPRPQHGPGGGTTSRSTSRSARAQLELGGDRAAQLAELDGLRAQRHAGVEAAEVEQLARQARQRRSSRCAPRDLAPGVVDGRARPSRRSSSSSSSMPGSEVSGVRSSCEAVATNARRASSWRRSAACIAASARARSPTSSRPSSRGAARRCPPRRPAARRARRRARRRPSVVASARPSSERDARARRRRRRGTRCGPASTRGGDVGQRLWATSTKSAARSLARRS